MKGERRGMGGWIFGLALCNLLRLRSRYNWGGGCLGTRDEQPSRRRGKGNGVTRHEGVDRRRDTGRRFMFLPAIYKPIALRARSAAGLKNLLGNWWTKVQLQLSYHCTATQVATQHKSSHRNSDRGKASIFWF